MSSKCEWRKLSDVRKGDVTAYGHEVVVAPIRYLGDCGMYALKSPDGLVYTDVWSWDEEIWMLRRN